MPKPTKWPVRPAKTQSDQSSLGTHRVAKVPNLLHVDSEDSDAQADPSVR